MATAETPGPDSGSLGHLPDNDPEETQEWLDSLDGLVDKDSDRARLILLRLLKRAGGHGLNVSETTSTDYINSIVPDQEPEFPGDEHHERRIRAYIGRAGAVIGPRGHAAGGRGRITHRRLPIARQ